MNHIASRVLQESEPKWFEERKSNKPDRRYETKDSYSALLSLRKANIATFLEVMAIYFYVNIKCADFETAKLILDLGVC